MSENDPWTFIGQEALREQYTSGLSFYEKCQLHDEMIAAAKLFTAGEFSQQPRYPGGLVHLDEVWETE